MSLDIMQFIVFLNIDWMDRQCPFNLLGEAWHTLTIIFRSTQWVEWQRKYEKAWKEPLCQESDVGTATSPLSYWVDSQNTLLSALIAADRVPKGRPFTVMSFTSVEPADIHTGRMAAQHSVSVYGPLISKNTHK